MCHFRTSPPRGCEGQKRIWQREARSGLWSFFDRVNTLGVEGEIILDRHDGSVWGLITPHSIDRTLAAERNAEVAAIPLVRAVGGALGAVEEPHVDVLARDVLNGGIRRFAS